MNIQASLLSPLTSTATAASHPASQPVAVPETADLVDVNATDAKSISLDYDCFVLKVLKYSEDDLPEILEAARKVTMDYETEKVNHQQNIMIASVL